MIGEKIKSRQPRVKVIFYLESPNASEVKLAGDFNKWSIKKHPMKKNAAGQWQKTVMLYPGRYEYKFLVNGKWELDPDNDWKCINCFGTGNNIISVKKK
ncbi:MAG: glycogen-binding domain-containing protein [Desulfobacterales bacterium]|nr:glycogen-binding domain-containing protein [Desulfobacterales bacterium]